MKGKLLVIGFGPGSFEHITQRAREAIQESDMIIGYKTYVELIQGLLTNQQIISTGMTEEVSRAQEAVKQAEAGKTVAVISSGDAGVYGMAGLVYEVLIEKGWKKETGVELEVIPGISAINSCASLLGAPVMHDACTISLSDHLTPWELIEKRIEAAAQADFVVAFYNPKSGRRTRQIVEAQRILLKYRSPDTPVGLVKSAYRDREEVVMTNLKDMLNHEIGMLTTVVVGNSSTFFYDDLMITPRGYQRKYTLNQTEQPLRPHQRLRKEAEPWALDQEETVEQTASAIEAVQTKPEETATSRALAEEALQAILGETTSGVVHQPIQSIFEVAVSPGLANKKFTPVQMTTLAEVVGEKGTMEYTPDHQIKLQIPTAQPDVIIKKLQAASFLLSPVGDVFTIKACDFCDGEKSDAIPHTEELQKRLGGMDMPKELKLGINGCGMACYGAVQEDIGIVYRKGAFDLFLGAKTVGRNAHSGQIVAEGIAPDDIVEIVENIVHEYKEKGHPNERFHKFFKRVKNVYGFDYQDITPKIKVEPAPCGD
ncbi:precorrin-3B C(17)-methyltransferase [Priestia megaterium]|uniref:precorrin-3B C(17)-methyltransferase n=1 Tax=Priestia megaterium TaxID=1404 RepID=UPI00094C38D8|nr:precorrin-3B C(17)-methyltransferase [Priestia megaterium]MCM3096672.1 precorrin-3B C(17)-methyltransferase [Priestia megaterium]MCP1452035.1 precorrin-3B C17-methyltransferase [Priestia megaterium]MCU7738694.1 precorrin-3B C(17)-methyltransferase [Priestia megaterium]MED4027829.1 precorrin-3B C(17)-methyltransferase [Priestia megaterium]OLO28802.1 precorrin-3B C(17)-methyltransferase [Priestia megaterium]